MHVRHLLRDLPRTSCGGAPVSDFAAHLQAARKQEIDAVVAERVANVVYNYDQPAGIDAERAMQAIVRTFAPYREQYGLK
jgi:hypothetical protein